MKKFPEDSLDSIEQLNAAEILKNFKFYGNFWEEFIGVRRLPNNQLMPYGLVIPANINKGLEKLYEEICISHYSLFCQLSGAHYQLDQSKSALKMGRKERHFYFWEACDNFYQHLQNCIYMVYHISDAMRQIRSLSKGKAGFLSDLRKNGFINIADKIEKFQQHLTTLRGTMVHFGRVGAYEINGTYFFPIPFKKNLLWSELNSKTQETQEITKQMTTDLETLESILDGVDQYNADILRSTLSAKGVSINYG